MKSVSAHVSGVKTSGVRAALAAALLLSLPFAVGQPIPPSPTCPPGTTREEGALMLLSGFETDSADTTEPPARP